MEIPAKTITDAWMEGYLLGVEDCLKDTDQILDSLFVGTDVEAVQKVRRRILKTQEEGLASRKRLQGTM